MSALIPVSFSFCVLSGKVLLLSITLLGSAYSKEMNYPKSPQTGVARSPEVTIVESTDTASMEISVLIYNVCGLPWPTAKGKKSRDTDDQGNRIPIAVFLS